MTREVGEGGKERGGNGGKTWELREGEDQGGKRERGKGRLYLSHVKNEGKIDGFLRERQVPSLP